MKHLLLTTIAAVVLAEAGFADAIHDAAYNGNIAVVRTELNKDVDVNAKDADGNTPLDMAIWGEYTEIAELLITNGADVNLIDEDGYTPLDKAFTGNYDEMAAVLRAHGAVKVYASNNSMDTGTTWLLIIGYSLGIVSIFLSLIAKGRRGRRGGSGGEGGCGGGCGGCGAGGCGGGE